jgi:hypothetical protein
MYIAIHDSFAEKRREAELNKVGLAAETFCIVDVFNIGFVNVWGFGKVEPVSPRCSAGVGM